MTALPLCAHCQQPVQPGQGREVDVHQGTSASPTLIIHADPAACARTVPVRRTP